MTSWLALLKKEFLLTRVIFFIGIGLILAVLGVTYFIELKNPELTGIMLGAMVAGAAAHTFYLPIYTIVSMFRESNTLHLWLHSPHSMYGLLFAKGVSGLLCMICSLLLNGAIVLALGNAFLAENFAALTLWDNVILSGGAGIFLTGSSLYMALYILFFISVYFVLRGWIGKWAWLIVLLLFIAVSWITDLIGSTAIYQTITNWGTISYDLQTPLLQQLPASTLNFSIGTVLVQFLMIVVLFIVSAKLIDKKVEV